MGKATEGLVLNDHPFLRMTTTTIFSMSGGAFHHNRAESVRRFCAPEYGLFPQPSSRNDTAQIVKDIFILVWMMGALFGEIVRITVHPSQIKRNAGTRTDRNHAVLRGLSTQERDEFFIVLKPLVALTE